jgi:O-succinylbenzoic acid--CoA ligase
MPAGAEASLSGVSADAWLPRAAARNPRRLAVNGLTYAALMGAAGAAAGELRRTGIGRGDRVALLLEPGADFAVALHACLLTGAVAVPVDVRLRGGERAAQTAGCAAIVDRPLPRDGVVAPALDATHDLGAVAVVVHTSGSSGPPKPVELTYGNWLWSAIGSAVALGARADDAWLCALPVSHVGGLSILLRSAIHATHAIVHDRFDTTRCLEALADPRGATLVSLVPTTLARLLDAGLARPPRLRCALIGGGPVTPALMARAQAAGVPVAQTYGLSEACSQVTTARPGDVQADAGPPLFCSRVRIASDGTDAGAEGEILVRGPTVARSAAGPGGWLATGDLGVLDAAGRLTVTGRRADTIVTGGENVAPAEVEAVLAEHPAVAEAVVYGLPDPEWGERVAATIVPVPGATPDPDDLRRHCAARLAPFKVPKQFAAVAAVPRTSTGKVLRMDVRNSAIVFHQITAHNPSS